MIRQERDASLQDSGYIFIASSDSIGEGEMMEVSVGKETVLVARVDGSVYAVDGICSHAYSELVDGELEDNCLYCPLHFACFDIRNGDVLEGPADEPLSVYTVTEQKSSIWIKIER
ncbi:Rieske (2Fe-2S) protein [Salibacterium halotolerans]|uniref:3-phenylpropionate/trans-cinnamate dioxygenase ferredoxin subunit/anthranilate 1,2-dioxygenase large subunit/anthranilate 1,2-dioxygenase ferredoxin subunit n=1 Tax=Salibacterium halotolerans TaxID=1884432 RepID=A0A1I5M0K1_9BACI|nr:non-heme iron oxygenase ferredoxin subunit [Salibacterium halotolerans]SFP02990.1 3-phenylpropionate/trans-cinnamate dioxygenase ferredoxin subunit/anthranilate 1,2-dioxygenase large subunit/anthranilate 1,2-dioxygenase ferredoxin subunit [Salibacterium halotolerans]